MASPRHSPLRIPITALLFAATLSAYQEEIGLNALRLRDASLDGPGIVVGQIEAQQKDTDNYQTDPADTGLNSTLFTYYDTESPWSANGASFDITRESGHANTVGSRFFGITSGTQNTDGVTPGVSAIEVFEATYYFNEVILNGTQTNASIINQSFVFTGLSESDSDTVDQNYDNYADTHNVLFVNGINNNGAVPSPARAYNGIAVNVAGDPATGPSDGRSKPDISAPGSTLTSFVTPLVSGSAAILRQSALNNDAGANTSASASDIRTLKALLLNGATKPMGWSQNNTQPLDENYGSGILVVNESHLQLIAGQYAPSADDIQTVADSEHLPPLPVPSSIGAYKGWALDSITNTADTGGRPGERNQYDATDHFFFDLSADAASSFYLASTLVWNRQSGRSSINNLDLFLYTESGTLIASSHSTVDNVEHIYQRHISPGKYVLQVHKPYNSGRITNSETYALAFNFHPAPTPGTPTNISATTVSTSAINLSWTDTSDDETLYRIERRVSGGTFETIATIDADSTSYSDSELYAGTLYDYRISAFNAQAEASTSTSATTYSKIEAWRLSYFGTTSNTGDAADNFDFDLDSISNLVEFLTGTDPKEFSPNPLDISLLSVNRQISFNWQVDSGFKFSIGYTEDLSIGFTYYDSATLDNDLSIELQHDNITSPSDGFETRTYSIRDNVDTSKAFFRLIAE